MTTSIPISGLNNYSPIKTQDFVVLVESASLTTFRTSVKSFIDIQTSSGSVISSSWSSASLFSTSCSFASNSISSITSSFLTYPNTSTSSFSINSISSSYAKSSSYAASSSFSVTSSYNTGTSSFAITSSYNTGTSSFAITSSYNTGTSSFANNSVSSSYAKVSSTSISSSYALTASYALTNGYYFSSSLFTLPSTETGGIVANISHGFPGTPSSVRWVMVCQTASLGYAVGDEVSSNNFIYGQQTGGPQDYICPIFSEGANNHSIFLIIIKRDRAPLFGTMLIRKDTFNVDFFPYNVPITSWKAKCYARY